MLILTTIAPFLQTQPTKLKLAESIEPLIGKLLEPEPQIKKFAIEALGILGDNKATKPLLELLKDDDLMVRQKAVDALIEIADADVISGNTCACWLCETCSCEKQQ